MHNKVMRMGALVCSRLKFWEQFQSRAREHSVVVRKRCWVQDGRWSDQGSPLPTLTPLLKPNDYSRFIISTYKSSLFAVTLTFSWTTRLTPTSGRGIQFACFQSQIATESERCFFGSCFSVALLLHFGHEKPERANAHIILFQTTHCKLFIAIHGDLHHQSEATLYCSCIHSHRDLRSIGAGFANTQSDRKPIFLAQWDSSMATALGWRSTGPKSDLCENELLIQFVAPTTAISFRLRRPVKRKEQVPGRRINN